MYLCPTEDLISINDSLKLDIEKIRCKRIFLTGATGFIGKNLLESLLWLNKSNKLDIEIFSISRNPERFFNQYPHFKTHSQFQLFQGDICDDINFPVPKIDLTIHAATDVVKQKSPIDIFNACVKGTSNVLEFSKRMGCQEFLLLSSGAIYGSSTQKNISFTETYSGAINLTSSRSAYPLGKQMSEWLAHQHADQSMRVKVARCFAFVGPYLPIDEHFAIGNFIQSALLNQSISINGDGTPLRTYLYTSDLCVWLLKILLNGVSRSIYNVGGGEILSIKELADMVVAQLNKSIKIDVHHLESGGIDSYIPNLDKVFGELGLKQTVSIKEAINKTANWNKKYADI